MLGYRDFAPRLIKKLDEFEPFDNVVAAANKWLAKSGVKVLHVETVLQRPQSPDFFQFMRVWFELPTGATHPYRD